MSVPLAILGDSPADHVAGLERLRGPVTVVRRCEELAELLAVCESGLAEVALIAGQAEDVPGHLLDRLTSGGIPVLVLTASRRQAERFTGLGARVLPPGVSAADLAAEVLDAVTARDRPVGALAADDAAAAGPDGYAPGDGDTDGGSAAKARPPAGGADAGGPTSPGASGAGTAHGETGPTARGEPAPGARGRAGKGSAATGRARKGRAAAGASRARGTDADATAGDVPAAAGSPGAGPPGRGETGRRSDGGGIHGPGRATAREDTPTRAVDRADGHVAGIPDTASPEHGRGEPVDAPFDVGDGRGLVIAVWGPTGGPGRSTVAVNLAAELAAELGTAYLLDADTYGSSTAVMLGLLDETAPVAQACRLADQGLLDVAALHRVAADVVVGGGRLRALTGLTRPDRWPEVRPSALGAVIDLCRATARATVIDCGFCLEADEELSFDTVAPRRNGATLRSLEQADVVLAVGSADAIGLPRLVKGLADLAEAVPTASPVVVINRVRRESVGRGSRQQVRDAWSRYGPDLPIAALLPADSAADAALLGGTVLRESAPASDLRAGIRTLVPVAFGLDPVDRGARRWWFRRDRAAGASTSTAVAAD